MLVAAAGPLSVTDSLSVKTCPVMGFVVLTISVTVTLAIWLHINAGVTRSSRVSRAGAHWLLRLGAALAAFFDSEWNGKLILGTFLGYSSPRGGHG